MTWDEYATAWSRLHGGFDPRAANGIVRRWVLTAYTMGSWLGRRRVSPMSVTTTGLGVCLAVPLAALAGGPGLVLGAALVLLAAVVDGLDGAVAVVTGRVTRTGFVYDSVADRLGELAWLAAFWVAGAPGWLIVITGAVSWLHEYVRARAAAAGMSEIGTVTVGERPTRALAAGFGLLAAALGVVWPPVALWLALQCAGLAQLSAAVRRALA
ncbi:CDP-alcohol phosphatidyltransferase family protein [Actinoplanes sp. NPDC051851]|uniref:CDP-alcohol phosphatidyltransferase family protein n=1 Tax=Actinoplanes sp. NPDC051851 TaxID=3154753 RepID=UPI0034176ACE